MAKTILTGVRIFAVGADLTGASNKAEVSVEVEDKDVTTFASDGWTEVVGGLSNAEISAEGYWEAGDPSKVDDATWDQLGGVGPWTLAPVAATAGSLAYLTNAMRANYTLGGEVGDVAPWTSSALSSWPLVRGLVAHNPGTLRTATGSSSGLQIAGGVPAGQRLYVALHVLSVAGTTPSITVKVESDTDNTFSAPVEQLAFSSANSVGGQILRTDGDAIADEWFRVTWTIAGTNPQFLFCASLGVA